MGDTGRDDLGLMTALEDIEVLDVEVEETDNFELGLLGHGLPSTDSSLNFQKASLLKHCLSIVVNIVLDEVLLASLSKALYCPWRNVRRSLMRTLDSLTGEFLRTICSKILFHSLHTI